MTRGPIHTAALDTAQSSVQRFLALHDGHAVAVPQIVEWAVDAAIGSLAKSLLPKPAAEPAKAVLSDGGGNIHERGPTALGGPPEVLRSKSREMGFNGDVCGNCGNFTLKQTGTCKTCASCGANDGCS